MVGLGGAQFSAASSAPWQGMMLALAAAFCYAIAVAVSKSLTQVPPQFVVACLLSLGALLWWPWAQAPGPQAGPGHWGLLLILGFIHTGLMSALLP